MRRYTPLAFIAISLMAIFVAFGTEGAVTTTGAGGSGSGPTPPPSQTYLQWVQSLNPTFVYALDDTSGTTAVDSSTNANNGTYAASGVTLNQSEQGCCGTNTVLFSNGTSTEVNGQVTSPIEETNSIFLGSFTIGVEVYIQTSFPGYGNYDIVGTDTAAAAEECNSGSGAGFALQLNSTGYAISYGQNGSDTGCGIKTTTQTTQLTGWHLYNIVYDATAQTVSVYIDGASVYSETYTGLMNGANTYDLSFGNIASDAANGTACPCYLGYAYLAPSALTAAQISTGYSAWSTPVPTPTPDYPTPGPSTTLPPEGMYTSCEIDTALSSCESDDSTMASLGMTREVNYLSTAAYLTNTQSANSLEAWFAYDAGIGMSQYVALASTLTDSAGVLTGDSLYTSDNNIGDGCSAGTTNQDIISCIASVCNASAGCAGYYIYDEPGCPNQTIGYCAASLGGGNYQNIQTLGTYLQSVSPTKQIIGIQTGGLPLSDAQNAFSCNNQPPCATWPSPYTNTYITSQYTPNTGWDYYPVPEATNFGNITDIGTAAQNISSVLKANYPSEGLAFAGQAFSWYQESGQGCTSITVCPFPTTAQMQEMRDEALWFSYISGYPLNLLLWYYWPDTSCINTYTGCDAATNEASLKAAAFAPYPTSPPPTPTP